MNLSVIYSVQYSPPRTGKLGVSVVLFVVVVFVSVVQVAWLVW